MSRLMPLAELLPDVAGIPADLVIGGLVQDSRELRPGDAFVAIEGFGSHGLAFAAKAKAAGAGAILFEPPAPAELPPPDGAIAVPHLRSRLGDLGHRFHGRASQSMTVVGVTGTNGKTSIVQLLAQAWHLRGTRSATIGTLGAGLYGQAVATGFTTPLVLRLHALIAQLHEEGAKALAMEVSSHALDQGRVDGVHFDVAVFTNLTRDHLDYHGDMTAYGAAKLRLFRWPGLKAAAINLDDEFGEQVYASLVEGREAGAAAQGQARAKAPLTPALSPASGGEGAGAQARAEAPLTPALSPASGGEGAGAQARAEAPLTPTLSPASGGEGAKAFAPSPLTASSSGERAGVRGALAPAGSSQLGIRPIGLSSRGNAEATVRAEQLQLDDTGISFQLVMGEQRHRVQSPLLGRFNVDNLLAVAGVLHALGDDAGQIAGTLSQLQPVHGRMNRLGGNGQPLVVIDYAHTPDALDQALASLRAHASARLICVFGCGGERDRGKRPQMAAVAEARADRVIVTDDNPRFESGDGIVAGILAGFQRPQEVIVQRDRTAAITRAIGEAAAGDIVLIAGKGHEPCQEIEGVQHPFDDTLVARQCLEART